MSNKSFTKGRHVTQFFGSANTNHTSEQTEAAMEQPTADNIPEVPHTQDTQAAPVLPEELPKISSYDQKPAGTKPDPRYIETRSKRLQLVVQPSVFNRIKAKAQAQGISMNELCHRLLDEGSRD